MRLYLGANLIVFCVEGSPAVKSFCSSPSVPLRNGFTEPDRNGLAVLMPHRSVTRPEGTRLNRA